MNKKTLVFLILLTSIAFSGSAYAQKVSVDIPDKEIVTLINSVYKTNFTVKNPSNETLNFILQLKGAYKQNVFFDKTLLSPANSTATFPLTFNPKEDIGRFDATIYGEAIGNSNLNFSIPISIWVQHPNKYDVRGFSHKIEDRVARSTITLKPDEKTDTKIDFNILDINGKAIKSASVSKVIENQEAVSQELDISDLATGKYKIRVSVIGYSVSREAEFDILIAKNIKQEKSVSKGFLFEEIKITLQNYGNIIENDYRVYEDIGKSKMVTLVTNVTDIIPKGDSNRYEFTIEKIRPGEVATIIYRLENWIGFVLIAIMSVVIVIVPLVAWLYLRKPKIIKKFVKKGGGQYTIILEIVNSKLQNLKDSTVRDIVQPVLKVRQSETAGVAPVIRSSQVGTEIVWKVGPLKKGESRTIYYSVDSVVGAESVRLSPATLTYITSRNRRISIMSNDLVLR